MQTETKQYDHLEVEPKWMNFWLENKLFKTQINQNRSTFSIALPPPNVTGELHMGHALGGTIQDILLRYNRMLGKDVLWQIGTDHAGIGTQIVVEKFLKKTENKSKYDLGRTEFIKRVELWKEEYGNKIITQMKLLGFSPDYERVRYTMDEHYAEAVKQTFIKYYNDGLIYRGNRITNWCPKCLTSLSDLEISKEPTKKKLYKIKYSIVGTKQSLVVATTRPETMFGDRAVAINPEDSRYTDFIKQVKDKPGSIQLLIPFTNITIPLILDDSVKTDFGTGALKVTPAHDANDYAIAAKHNLDKPIIMDKQGLLAKDPLVPEFLQGLDRFQARELIIEKLADQLIETTEYEQEKDLHDRCNTEIEPYLTDQWYLNMEQLAKTALATEASGRTKFLPERYSSIFQNWLNNIQDWCISRQIWWGHRIPVYYYEEAGKIKHYAADKARDPSHQQDEDVLDTWFSSALWPFETMKDDIKIFEHFYPTDILATAREIINLWVSRMIYSSEYFEGVEPFKTILIHPVVQTPDGKRMSKSKGNAIDPLDLIKRYGADASRMWYASVGVYGAQDVKFPGQHDKQTGWSSDQFEQYRKFANKLFNASKYLTLKLNEDKDFSPSYQFSTEDFNSTDKWILNKFTNILEQIKTSYDAYDLANIQKLIYEFLWYDYCDWYIEFCKTATSKAQKQILFYIFENSLRVLHPIMPFITEELWQELKVQYDFKQIASNILIDSSKAVSISYCKFPEAQSKLLDKSEASKQIELVIQIISNLRNLRQSLNISWASPINIQIHTTNSNDIEAITNNIEIICKITKAKSLELNQVNSISKPFNISLINDIKIIVPLAGLVDLEQLKNSIEKKITKITQDINLLSTKLASKNFIDNADTLKIREAQGLLAQAHKQQSIYQNELLDLS